MSSRRRNALLSRRTQLVGVAFLGVALILLVLRLVVPGALTSVTAPLFRASSGITYEFRSITAFFSTPAALTHELDAASASNSSLSNENRTLAAQVADLKKLLGTRAEAPPSILAAVVARPPTSPYDTLTLDQGSRAGVAVGSLVTGQGGVPVGTITSVTAASSRALLFSAPQSTTDGWVGANRVPVTVTGAGSGAFEASAPKDAGVVVGDSVYLATGGAVAIGTVIRLDSDASSASVTLRIQPLSNPFMLTWVLVSQT